MKTRGVVSRILVFIVCIVSLMLSASPEEILGREPGFGMADKSCNPTPSLRELREQAHYKALLAEKKKEIADAERALEKEKERRASKSDRFLTPWEIVNPDEWRVKVPELDHEDLRRSAKTDASLEFWRQCDSAWDKTLETASMVGFWGFLISFVLLVRMTWRMALQTIKSVFRAVLFFITEPFRRMRSKLDYNELLRLKDLRDKEILTEEEYQERVHAITSRR